MAKLPSGDIVVDASLLVGIATGDQHAMRFMIVISRSVSTSVNFGEVLYKLNQKANRTPAETEHALRKALGVRGDVTATSRDHGDTHR